MGCTFVHEPLNHIHQDTKSARKSQCVNVALRGLQVDSSLTRNVSYAVK